MKTMLTNHAWDRSYFYLQVIFVINTLASALPLEVINMYPTCSGGLTIT